MQVSYSPYWVPMERLHDAGKIDIDDFMFMGTYFLDSVTIHTYKHRDTRLYLNLSTEGYAYKYEATAYIPMDVNDAISRAYGKNEHQN